MDARRTSAFCIAIIVALSGLGFGTAHAEDLDFLIPPAGAPLLALDEDPSNAPPAQPPEVPAEPVVESIYPDAMPAPAPPIVGDIEAVRTPFTTPFTTAYPSPCAVPCETPCPAPCDPCIRRWDVRLEGQATWMSSLEGPFGLEAFTGSQMEWDGLEYGVGLGGGLGIQYALDPRTRIQFRASYLGLFEEDGTTSGNFAYAPPIPGIVPTNTAVIETEATLCTGELNWVHEITCAPCTHIDLGIGARATYLGEEASASNFGTAFNPGFPGAPYVESDVENLFVGAQFVAGIRWDLSRSFEIGLLFKPGLGYLRRSIDVRDQSIFAGGPHSTTSTEEELVFAFEFEFGATWQLSPCLALVGGYRLLFVDDVVRADDAMDFSHSHSGAVQATHEVDQLFAHSVYLGLNLSF